MNRSVLEVQSAQAGFYSRIAGTLENARFPANGGYYSFSQYEQDVSFIKALQNELLEEFSPVELDYDKVETRVLKVIEHLSETVGTSFGGKI